MDIKLFLKTEIKFPAPFNQRRRDDNKDRNFAFLRWRFGGREEKSSKNAVFLGNAMTIKF